LVASSLVDRRGKTIGEELHFHLWWGKLLAGREKKERLGRVKFTKGNSCSKYSPREGSFVDREPHGENMHRRLREYFVYLLNWFEFWRYLL